MFLEESLSKTPRAEIPWAQGAASLQLFESDMPEAGRKEVTQCHKPDILDGFYNPFMVMAGDGSSGCTWFITL
jgi:hypothetical protein